MGYAETAADYLARDGQEMNSGDRVLLPCSDPVPHYQRGRARVEPRLDGVE